MKRPRILLTGRNGQVGWELKYLLPYLGETIALGHQELDLTDRSAIQRVFHEVRPNIIVNAAAYTAVDQAETDIGLARAINTDAPAAMAEEARKLGAFLVHYSTDYVFDGSKRTPYEETDDTAPINVYGKTKLAGEQAIQRLNFPHLILRTEWVYATRGKNFLLTILRLASQRKELRIVDDQVGAPTWSREIASATYRILAQLYASGLEFARLAEFSGLYHLTAGGQTTWRLFGEAILREFSNTKVHSSWLSAISQGKQLVCESVVPIASTEHPALARRPLYSLLSNEKLRRVFGIVLPGWRAQLRETFTDGNLPDIITRVN